MARGKPLVAEVDSSNEAHCLQICTDEVIAHKRVGPASWTQIARLRPGTPLLSPEFAVSQTPLEHAFHELSRDCGPSKQVDVCEHASRESRLTRPRIAKARGINVQSSKTVRRVSERNPSIAVRLKSHLTNVVPSASKSLRCSPEKSISRIVTGRNLTLG